MLLACWPPLWYTPLCWEEQKCRWEQRRHEKGHMPRAPLHALIWSSEYHLYELYTQGQLEQRFRPADEAVWLAWLREVSSFAFHGPSGSLNVYLEKRPRGGLYWYAYHSSRGRTRKCYLGRTESLSLAHVEETAQILSHEQKAAQTLSQGGTLLSTKLVPPRLPGSMVERERLLTALDRTLATPLTPAFSPGWLGQNDRARRLGESTQGIGRLALAGRVGQYPSPLLGLADRGLAALREICTRLWRNCDGVTQIAPTAAAFCVAFRPAP